MGCVWITAIEYSVNEDCVYSKEFFMRMIYIVQYSIAYSKAYRCHCQLMTYCDVGSYHNNNRILVSFIDSGS